MVPTPHPMPHPRSGSKPARICQQANHVLGAPSSSPHRVRGVGIAPFAVSPHAPLAPDTLPGYPILGMAHLIQNKKKLLARISRIRGQLNGIEKALDAERDCGEVLLTLAACRGALNSLMAEILEDHVRQHVLGAQSTKDREVAAEELIEVIKRYLK
jgi:FrmR/RcnR family transcriptional regulator, repressor of rcnA expression